MNAALGPVLAGFLTVWVMVGLGYGAARLRLRGETAERVLNGFVFTYAMPALVFSVLSRASWRALASPALVPVLVGAGVVAAVAVAVHWWWGARGGARLAITAMAAGYLNAGNLGIPIAAQVLGDGALVVPFMLVQLTVMTPAVLLALDLGTASAARGSEAGSGRTLRRLGRTLALPLRNPVLIASLLGGLCAASGWRPPQVVLAPVDLLAGAAVPLALFTLGLALAPDTARGGVVTHGPPEPGWFSWLVAVLKVVVHPLLAYLVGRLLGLEPAMLQVAVVLAGLPSAQNMFLYASRYQAGERLARDVVVRSTLLSMLTLVLIAVLTRP
ncbi:MAG: AEC family transporter [Micromonosporaceae bacterium]